MTTVVRKSRRWSKTAAVLPPLQPEAKVSALPRSVIPKPARSRERVDPHGVITLIAMWEQEG